MKSDRTLLPTVRARSEIGEQRKTHGATGTFNRPWSPGGTTGPKSGLSFGTPSATCTLRVSGNLLTTVDIFTDRRKDYEIDKVTETRVADSIASQMKFSRTSNTASFGGSTVGVGANRLPDDLRS
jgi:hypothetical protein